MGWEPILPRENMLRDFMKDTPEDIASEHEIKQIGRETQSGFIKVGFSPVKKHEEMPTKDDLKNWELNNPGEPFSFSGKHMAAPISEFKPIKKDSGFTPVTQSPSQEKPILDVGKKYEPTGIGEPDLKDDSFWGDLNRHAEGTGRQIGNMIAWPFATTAAKATQISAQLQGMDPAKANEVQKEFMEKYGQPFGPNTKDFLSNPVIDTTMEIVDFGLRPGAERISKMVGDKQSPASPKDSKYGSHTLVEDDIMDALMLGGMKRPVEAIKNDFIDGKARRIPDDPPALPNPNDPVASAIAEQKNLTQVHNERTMQLYNENPKAYGVDTTGVRNPFNAGGTVDTPSELRVDPTDGFQRLIKEVTETLEAPEAAKDPTEFQKKHREMEKLGARLIEDVKEQGLTPRQVSDHFWEKTYPELPEEVQVRFQRLLNRQTKEAGGDLVTTAQNYHLPKDASYLERMDKWYVALMHEANNYPWGPKTKALLENKIDMQEIIDNPEAGRSLTDSLFSGKEGQDSLAYFKLLQQEKNGGDVNKILKYIESNSSDPFERILARALHDESKSFRLYVKEEESTAYGRARVDQIGGGGEMYLYIGTPEKPMMQGLHTITVLHEALHLRLQEIIELGRDSKTRPQYPEYARFTDELHNLWVGLLKALPKEERDNWKSPFYGVLEKQGSPGHELITWGLTYEPFIKLLKQTEVDSQGNAWFAFNKSIIEIMEEGDYHNEVLTKKMQQWNEYQAATKQDAFKELTDLVLPILESSKGTLHDIFNVQDVLDARTGWWKDFKNIYPDDITLGQPGMAAPSKKAKEIMDRLVSPYTDYNQMWTALGADLYKGPDLNRITGNIYPVSMVKNIARNPVVTFGFSKLRDVVGDAHALEKFLVESIRDFEKAPVDVKNRIVISLNEMNRPEQQELLGILRSQQYGPDWFQNPAALRVSDSELTHYGMHQSDIPLYRQTLEPLFKTILNIDKKSIAKGFNRNLESKVIGYFPRSFGFGKFIIEGVDVQGNTKFYRRVPTHEQAVDYTKRIQALGLHPSRKTAKDFSDFKGHIMALAQSDPTSVISKIGEKTIAAAEEHRRSQEFERNTKGIAGFVGQNLKDPKEIELLRQMVYNRIQMTVEAYKAARLIEEILRPVRQDILAQRFYPNATKWVNDIVTKELGGDLSDLKMVDNFIQWNLEGLHRATMPLKKAYKNVVVYRNEKTVDPTAHRELSRYVAATGSAYVLAGNIPNLITNAFSIPLVSLMGGWPDAQMLQHNPARAATLATAAHLQSMADIVAIAAGKADPEVKRFIDRALERGEVVANAFADIPEMRNEIEKTKPEKVMDYTLNIPRKLFNDPVEIATNMMSLLFYNRLFMLMYPNMPFKERYTKSVDLTKRYTGDYKSYNKALIFEKLGDVGAWASNFSIWMGTRIAQFHEVTKNAVTKAQITPLVAIMTAGIVVAGINGAPLAQDYENIRQRLSGIEWDGGKIMLPPLDKVLKDHDIPEQLRNGVVLNSTGLDLASRGKWAGFTDFGGVTYTLPAKMKDLYDYLSAYISGINPSEEGTKPSGENTKITSELTSALPTGISGLVRDSLLTRHLRGDGKVAVVGKHGTAQYHQKPPNETTLGLNDKRWNQMNFKTKDQGEETRDFFNTLYETKKYEKTIGTLKKTAVDQLVRMIDAQEIGDMALAKRMEENARANLLKYQKISPGDFKQWNKDILDSIQRENDTLEERQLKELVHSKSAGRIIMILNTLKTSGRIPKDE